MISTQLPRPIRLIGTTEPPVTKRTTRAEALGHLSDALDRLNEAEDTLRAIGAGEIDAFVFSESEERTTRLHALDG